MNSEDERFMRMALEEAKRAGEEGEVPIGAVLVSEGEVVGRGRNRPISLSDPTAHAEILALREGAARMENYRLPNSTLYVTIEPCTMCAGAIIQARVRRLVFGAEDSKTGAVRSIYTLLEGKLLNHRVEVTSGILLEECREILQRFFRQTAIKNFYRRDHSAAKPQLKGLIRIGGAGSYPQPLRSPVVERRRSGAMDNSPQRPIENKFLI